MAKGTSLAEATLNSEKIKLILLTYTSLKASGRQLVSQLVENIFKISWQLFESISD